MQEFDFSEDTLFHQRPHRVREAFLASPCTMSRFLLVQKLANYILGLPVFLKIKFTAHMFAYCLWLLLSYRGRVEQLWQRLYGQKSRNYLPFSSLQKKFADLCCSPSFQLTMEIVLEVQVKRLPIPHPEKDQLSFSTSLRVKY